MTDIKSLRTWIGQISFQRKSKLTYKGTESEEKKHEEEETVPEPGKRQSRDDLRIRDEGQRQVFGDHFRHILPGHLSQISKRSEDGHPSDQAENRIEADDDERVTTETIVKLVVGGQGDDHSVANGEGEEGLIESSFPTFRIQQLFDVRGEEETDALEGTLEKDTLDEEDSENEVGQRNGEDAHPADDLDATDAGDQDEQIDTEHGSKHRPVHILKVQWSSRLPLHKSVEELQCRALSIIGSLTRALSQQSRVWHADIRLSTRVLQI